MNALPAARHAPTGVLCDLRGFEHRSTKHAHGVPCPACIGLLGKRPPASAQVATKYLA